MTVLETIWIGDLRMRLVEVPAPELPRAFAPSHYLISDHLSDRRFVAIAGVGYHRDRAHKALNYFAQREQARLAAAQDDGR